MKKTTNSAVIIGGFERRIQDLIVDILKLSNSSVLQTNAEELEELESSLQRLTRELNDLIAAKKLQEALCSEELIQAATKLIKGLRQKIKNYGFRLTPVRMSNGTKVEVLVPYFARPCHEKNGKKRGTGYYPTLILLGVFDNCTPRLASDVSMSVAALASLKEAQDMLAARGCKLD